MGNRMCPRCGKPYPKGGTCPRCATARAPSRRTKAQEGARKESNPWRSRYRSVAYTKGRQAALARTGGRCAVSGVQIADWRDGRWVMRKNGGIHHIVPLSKGGTDDPSNLVPLEVGVHNRVDAELRRRARHGA